MNAARRKEVDAAIELLNQAQAALSDAHDAIETIKSDEQDYFDNMPESLQGGDKGSQAEEAISHLEDVISDIENFDISDLVAHLEDAKS